LAFLVGSTASSVSQHVPSPHKIGEESTWQSSSKPLHHGQNSRVWTARFEHDHGQKTLSSRLSGGQWPLSFGGSSGIPARR
jgi:hypothetical protein